MIIAMDLEHHSWAPFTQFYGKWQRWFMVGMAEVVSSDVDRGYTYLQTWG
jgi:hypothetical protein